MESELMIGQLNLHQQKSPNISIRTFLFLTLNIEHQCAG
jgi:hypothetical protein